MELQGRQHTQTLSGIMVKQEEQEAPCSTMTLLYQSQNITIYTQVFYAKISEKLASTDLAVVFF